MTPLPGTNNVLKVTTERTRGKSVTLRLEGRLTAAWVDEFGRAVADAMREGDAVTLNLDGLSFADDRGVDVIRLAIGRGARVTGGSEFIGALIGQERQQ
jgi:hypothetical protein